MVEPQKVRVSDSEGTYLGELLGLAEGERVVSCALGKLSVEEIPTVITVADPVAMAGFAGLEPPTREQLLQHLQKFPDDREEVEEVAALYGIEMGAESRRLAVDRARVARAPKRAAAAVGVSKHRRTNAEVVADVLELHHRDMLPAAIADVLNLSDRRVREIIRHANRR